MMNIDLSLRDEIFLIESNLKKEFHPDLSNSSLEDYEKKCLADMIKRMHCESCLRKGFHVVIALVKDFFEDVCKAKDVYISVMRGDSVEEILGKLDIEWHGRYCKAIVNIIVKAESKAESVDEIYERLRCLRNLDSLTCGLCIANDNLTADYCIEMIAYN